MLHPAEGFPKHVRQPWPWGCMSYAAYSLTGDERLLAGASECGEHRFLMQLADLGYFVVRLWVDQSLTHPAPDAWWQGQADKLGEHHFLPLLLGIRSLNHDCYHQVAALVEKKGVTILDPGAAAAKKFSLDDFLSTPYARAFSVDYLTDRALTLEYLPPMFGPDQPHVTDDTRARYYAANPAAQ